MFSRLKFKGREAGKKENEKKNNFFEIVHSFFIFILYNEFINGMEEGEYVKWPKSNS